MLFIAFSTSSYQKQFNKTSTTSPDFPDTPRNRNNDYVEVNFIKDLYDPMYRQTYKNKLKKVSGKVATGIEAGRSYCSEGIYLMDDTGVIMLTVESTTSNDINLRVYLSKEYLGKNVTIVGVYPTQEGSCEALICQCEDYLIVKSIEIN